MSNELAHRDLLAGLDTNLVRAHEHLTRHVCHTPLAVTCNTRKDGLCDGNHETPGEFDDEGAVSYTQLASLEAFASEVGWPVTYHDGILPSVLNQEELKLVGAGDLTSNAERRHVLGLTRVQFNLFKGTDDPAFRGVEVLGDMSDASRFRVLSHEMTHVLLNAGALKIGGPAPMVRAIVPDEIKALEEVAAESAAWLVGQELGTSDGRYSASYLQNHSGQHEFMLEMARPLAVRTADTLLQKIG